MIRTHTTPIRAGKKASALLAVVATSAIILISVSTLVAFAGTQRTNIARQAIHQREVAAAERAVDSIVSRIIYTGRYRPDGLDGAYPSFHNKILSFTVPSNFLPGFEMHDTSIVSLTGTTPVYETINDPTDDWHGFSVLRMDYRVTAQVKEVGGTADRLTHPGVRLSRIVRVELIPIYQYAIFYNNTLELDAGQRIDVVGKVHTNGDFYLTTSSEAWYHKAITVANNFYSGIYEPHTGRGNTGSTNINVTTNGAGAFDRVQGTEQSSTQWLDSRYTNWVEEVTDRFNGFLRDQALGVLPIGLPLPEGVNPHVIIERTNAADSPAIAGQKFENSADIKIYGDPANPATLVVKNKNGQTIPSTYVDAGGVTRNWLSTSYFYNGREEKRIYTIDVDAGRMREAVQRGALALGNGVVYVGPTQPTGSFSPPRQAAARLTNAAAVPADATFGSFTFATGAPVYIKGNLNSPANPNDRKMVIIAGDAINMLSNAFTDSAYQAATSGNGPNLGASPTQTNAIFMGGNTPSDDPAYYGRYSGGAENFFRYLENWGSANTHTFNGTLMNLWKSQIANKPWDKDPTPGVQSAGYYGAPRRVWAWDQGFQTKFPPPHWPVFWVFKTIDWQTETPQTS